MRASAPHVASQGSEASAADGALPVRARGLLKRYGELIAVDHIDLNVHGGDVYFAVIASVWGELRDHRRRGAGDRLAVIHLHQAGAAVALGDDDVGRAVTVDIAGGNVDAALEAAAEDVEVADCRRCHAEAVR